MQDQLELLVDSVMSFGVYAGATGITNGRCHGLWGLYSSMQDQLELLMDGVMSFGVYILVCRVN